MSTSRNLEISFAKGVAICLMVMGHARVSSYLGNFIYLFHMPLFFILSGYFFPYSKLNSFNECLKYWLRKIRGLYIPFVKWGVFFLFFSFVLYYGGLEEKCFNLNQVGDRLFHIFFFMEKFGPYLVGYWFIHDLFIISVVAGYLAFLFKERFCKLFIFLIPVSIAVCILFSYILAEQELSIAGIEGFRRLCLGFSFFLFGYYYRVNEESRFYSWNNFIIIFILLSIQTVWGFMDMSHIHYEQIFSYFLFAVLGTFMILALAHLLPRGNKLYRFFAYAGDHSLAILTFHILVFRILNYIFVYAMGLERGRIYEFPSILFDYQIVYGMVYSILAIIIPLAFIRSKNSFIRHFIK